LDLLPIHPYFYPLLRSSDAAVGAAGEDEEEEGVVRSWPEVEVAAAAEEEEGEGETSFVEEEEDLVDRKIVVLHVGTAVEERTEVDDVAVAGSTAAAAEREEDGGEEGRTRSTRGKLVVHSAWESPTPLHNQKHIH